jgi:hypothetical protein
MKHPIREFIQVFRAGQRAQRQGRTGEFVRAAKENEQIQKTMMRPMRYEAIDGAGEIACATMLLGFALSSYMYVLLPPASLWTHGIAWLLFFVGAFGPYCTHKAIKRFITWPRTGYVAYRRDSKSFRIGMVAGGVVAVGISLGLVFLLRSELRHTGAISPGIISPGATPASPIGYTRKTMLALLVVSNAFLYLMMAASTIRKKPWKWLLLVLIVLGPLEINLLVPGNVIELSRPVMLFLGLVWLLSGGATLFSYLRHSQPPAAEAA